MAVPGADINFKGKSLAEWKEELGNRYSIDQLRQMIWEGGDIGKLALQERGLLTA